MSRVRWAAVSACVSMCILVLGGCGSSGSSSSDGTAAVLEGAWWGYNFEVANGTPTIPGPKVVGIQVNSTRQITHVLQAGVWSELAAPSQIDEIAADSRYRIEGTDLPDESAPDAAAFILLGSDQEHLGLVILDDVNDRIELNSLQLDNSAVATPPSDPTAPLNASQFAGTWSGTAFDIGAASPPDFNLVDAASLTFVATGPDLALQSGSTFLGRIIDSTGQAFNDGGAPEFAFFAEIADFFPLAFLATPDLTGMMVAVCGDDGNIDCTFFEGNIPTPITPFNSDGWGFAWLEAE